MTVQKYTVQKCHDSTEVHSTEVIKSMFLRADLKSKASGRGMIVWTRIWRMTMTSMMTTKASIDENGSHRRSPTSVGSLISSNESMVTKATRGSANQYQVPVAIDS